MKKEDLKRIRTYYKLTQPKMADLIGLKTQNHISNMENGKMNISGTIDKLLEIYDFNPWIVDRFLKK